MREIDARRGTFRQRGYTEEWRRLSRMHLSEYPMCVGVPPGCHGELGKFAEVTDHIIPLWAGGELLDPGNLQSLCRACNTAKDALDRKKYVEVERT